MAQPLLVLSHWREANGYSQLQAGRILGVTAAQVCRYESGKKRIPPEKVPAVEAITSIPRELLRPDVYRAVSRDEGARMLQEAS